MNGFWTRPGGGEVKTHLGLCEVLGDLGRISQGRSLQCGHCANLQYPSGTFSHQRNPSLSEHSCRRTAFQTGQCIVTCCPGIIRRFLGHRCLSPASIVSHVRSCTTTFGCSRRETRNNLFATIDTIRLQQPRLAVLENAVGLRRVLPQVLRMIRALNLYVVVQLQLDPTEFGLPVRRPRLYFLLVRRDVALTTDESELGDLASRMLGRMRQQRTTSFHSCLLPAEHQVVRDYNKRLATAHKKNKFCGRVGLRPCGRWVDKHAAFRLAHGIPRSVSSTSAQPSADVLLLTSPRERDLWSLALASCKSQSLIVDISQSVGRGSLSDGTLPTITPRCRLCIRSAGRQLSSIEKNDICRFAGAFVQVPC